MRTRIRAIAVAMSAVTGVLFAVAASGPASGHGGNPDMLPAGSYACTRWVQSSQGAYISGMTNSPAATFTTRMSTTLGGPETVIFTSVTREISYQIPGNAYPTYRILVTPPTAGTFFLRNCVEATNGPLYWFRLQVESAVRPSIGHGPLQARLGPGGRHCGFSVDGPTIGLGDGAARLTATSTVPVRFSIIGMNEDYASLGPVFSVTATSVDRVFTPASNVSETSACAENTSNAVAVVSFSLSPA
jgi:hypothetical protein